METIFALTTPSGRSGVAVIRVSGPAALESAAGLCGVLKPREACLRTLKNPKTHEIIDRALILTFPGPGSYTGEDVVEYHVHGSAAVIAALLEVLAVQNDHRLAEPGEFTRRAFENGKLDLTEAEAVADLIDAQTQAQRQQALSQLGGALSALYQGWTEQLKTILAHVEADLEFPDEDLPNGILPQLLPDLKGIQAQISEHLNDNRRGERLRDGFHVVIIGAPNAGKSTLINALAQRDIAIVSDTPGTTRDILEAHLDIGGFPVILSDTAGLRPDQIAADAQGTIESEGIRRALERAREADLKILLFDGTAAEPDKHTLELSSKAALCVINKIDQAKDNPKHEALEKALKISAKSGDGLSALLEDIAQRLEQLAKPADTPSLTRQRHRSALEEAHEALERCIEATLPELAAEDIRLVVRALGRITGRVDVEDILDVVFQDFCIGK